MNRNIISHESGHAAGLLLLGRLPEVVRVDNPDLDATYSGETRPDYRTEALDRSYAGDLILSILLGPIAADESPWPPDWPLDPDSEVSDVRHLAQLVDYLDLGVNQWRAYVAIAYHVADSPEFKALQALIASALAMVPVLSGSDLREVIGPESAAKYLDEGVTDV